MNILTTTVPVWVSMTFIFTFPIAIFTIANTAKLADTSAGFDGEKTRKIVLFVGLSYLLTVGIVTMTGFFTVNTLPPRILLTTTLPLLIFYLLFVSKTKMYGRFLENTPLESIIRLHIFRLVGVFFLITYFYGALPKYFALSGGIGDIFAAVTAIFVANAVEKKKSYARPLTYVWNIVGLLDIINVAIAAVISTKLSIENGTKGVVAIAEFPFCWIPAFAPATIVFLHIMIFKKLRRA